MKISKYTFFFDIDNNEYYLYNSISNALIEVDKDSYQILYNKWRAKATLSILDIDCELYDMLRLKRFVIENDLDNFLFYKSVLAYQRSDMSNMHLTLAPTMDCCFKCNYCFENYKNPTYMTETVMDSIVKYLSSLKNNPQFRLTWFGGEPLMALTQIEQLYDKM